MGLLRRPGFLAALAAVAVQASPAGACPVCDSAAGRQVRADLFGDRFLPTAAAVLLPIPALAGLAAAIHFGFPGRSGTTARRTGPSRSAAGVCP